MYQIEHQWQQVKSNENSDFKNHKDDGDKFLSDEKQIKLQHPQDLSNETAMATRRI